MQPSRKFALSRLGILALCGLAAADVLVAFVVPEIAGQVTSALGQLGLAIAGITGVGASAIAYVDHGSGGLTSSQGDRVLAAQRVDGARADERP